MKIQTHMVLLHTRFIHVPTWRITRPTNNNRLHFFSGEQRRHHRVHQRTVTIETRVSRRDPPQAKWASVYGRGLSTVRSTGASIEPRTGSGSTRTIVTIPGRISGMVSGAEAAVIHQAVHVCSIVRHQPSMHHSRLEMLAFGVLPLSFVGVLVAAEGLAGGEVSAAVMALESPAALAAVFGAALAYVGVVGVSIVLVFFSVLTHIVVEY